MPPLRRFLRFLLEAMFFMCMFNSMFRASLAVKNKSLSKDAIKWTRTLSSYQEKDLNQALMNMLDYNNFNTTLDNILIPRVPGTKSHRLVRKYIVSEMKLLGWKVEEDTFKDQTPYGRKPFANIIATQNPNACQRLTLACHYDSLRSWKYKFLGATDSAVPCAMLIHVARKLHSSLKEHTKTNQAVTLQLIFFDGEEAFKKWSATDSLYGSKHLATKWAKTEAFREGDGNHCSNKDYASYLDRMDVMILLDLIGTANTTFCSYFFGTYHLYSQFIEIEKRLNSKGLLETELPDGETHYFEDIKLLPLVDDDHTPFAERERFLGDSDHRF